MKLLVLGGTAFVGRHLVDAALLRGHSVSIFTRGRTSPSLYPAAEHLRGDRERDLSPLVGREWDAVLDTSGYLPRVVRASAGLLADSVGSYVFLSSLSVYDAAERLDESSPLQTAEDPASEDVGVAYGPLKAMCEEEVLAALGSRALVVRAGLTVGRYDTTGRFAYWPRRVAAGGEVLAPGRPDARIWFIDARDLADWIVHLVEARVHGVFNAVGPGEPLTMSGLLEECCRATRSDATFTWLDDRFLLSHGVLPYTELPLWVPELDGGYPVVDTNRATAAGLTFRPLADTIHDALAWETGSGAEVIAPFGIARPPAGLLSRRERALLSAWHRGDGTLTGALPRTLRVAS